MNIKYSKLIVFLLVAANIAFTYKILLLFEQTGTEPTTLIVSWFGFTTGELGWLSMITKAKVKKGGDESG